MGVIPVRSLKKLCFNIKNFTYLSCSIIGININNHENN